MIRSFVSDFTARAAHLALRIQQAPEGRVTADAINAHWALTSALQLDARVLEPLLRRWAPEAAERSDRNVLHNSTLPPHLLPPSRKREGAVGSDAQSPHSASRPGGSKQTARSEAHVDSSAHTLDRRPPSSLPSSGQSMTLDDMNDHLPSGRPPDPTGPPAPCAPAASL